VNDIQVQPRGGSHPGNETVESVAIYISNTFPCIQNDHHETFAFEMEIAN
jgi:hypothetical protein